MTVEMKWELHLACSNCNASVHITSDLGDKFKLSRDYKTERLLKEAEILVSTGSYAKPPEWLPTYRSVVEEVVDGNLFSHRYRVKETQTRYVKCPVCKSRIYVC